VAKKSRVSFAKREREQKKAEKAAQKRTRRDERKDSPAPLPDTEEYITSDADDDDHGDRSKHQS